MSGRESGRKPEKCLTWKAGQIYHVLYYLPRLMNKRERSGRAEMNDKSKKDVTKMIRELRARLELTQEQFAAKVGVTFSTVNRWESGRSNPSPLARRRISELIEYAEKGKRDSLLEGQTL